MKRKLLTILGLFVPVKQEDGTWGPSIGIEGIPVGTVLVLVSVTFSIIAVLIIR